MLALLDDSASRPEHLAAVCRAIEDMRDGLSEVNTLDRVAAIGLYSPFHFHRIFRQVTATTPARYLAGLRMQHAKKLLAETSRSVIDIGVDCGYQSLGTFTTQFTRLVGQPPGRFRQLIDALGSERVMGELPRISGTGQTLAINCHHPAEAGAGARTVIAALFPADLPQGRPPAFSVHTGGGLSRLSHDPPVGDYSAFAVSVPDETPAVEFAIGRAAELLVGRKSVVVESVSRLGDGWFDPGTDQIAVRMRPPNPWDPPIVSAAPVLYLAGAP